MGEKSDKYHTISHKKEHPASQNKKSKSYQMLHHIKTHIPKTLIFSLLWVWPHGHWTWNACSYKMFNTESLITVCILELFFKLKDHFPQTKLLLTCTHDLSTFTTHRFDPGPGVTSTIFIFYFFNFKWNKFCIFFFIILCVASFF